MAVKDYFGEFFDNLLVGSGASMGTEGILDIGAMTDEWGNTMSHDIWPENLWVNVWVATACTASGKSKAYMQIQLKHGDTSACSFVAADTGKMSFGIWSDFAAGAKLWSVAVTGSRLHRYTKLEVTSSQILTGRLDGFLTIGPPETQH